MTFADFIDLIKWAFVLLLGGVAGIGITRRINTAQAKDDAAARVDIAEARGEERMHAGQSAELSRLQHLVEQMGGELRSLSRRVRELEADVGVLEAYFDAIILCDACRSMNQKIIERTASVFKRSARAEGHCHGHKPADTPDGGTPTEH